MGEGNVRVQEFIGKGTRLLRKCLAECQLTSAAASGQREQLLLRAAHKGYMHLVIELLCPSGVYDGSGSVFPVSTNISDDDKNTILHLAVLSKSVALLKWILRHLRQNEKTGH